MVNVKASEKRGPNARNEYKPTDMTIKELERRIWKNRKLLKNLKEEREQKESSHSLKINKRRKTMSHAQDCLHSHMMKMMVDCDAMGFVYSIIPHKGKPVSESSDNLRGWWKERATFDPDGPAAIANFEEESEHDQVCCPFTCILFNIFFYSM